MVRLSREKGRGRELSVEPSCGAPELACWYVAEGRNPSEVMVFEQKFRGGN